MRWTTMQLHLVALIAFWSSKAKILADEERVTSSSDDLIVSKSGSACAEDGEAAAAAAAAEDNCSGLMQDAADNKNAFIYPAAAAVPPPPSAAAKTSITRKPMPFATRLETVGTELMTIPQRTVAGVSVQPNDLKSTAKHPPPDSRHPLSPCAPTEAADGDKDCTIFVASPPPPSPLSTAASTSGPGRDKRPTFGLPLQPAIPEEKRERQPERKNSLYPLTSQTTAAKASAKASQVIGINQTADGMKDKRPALEDATRYNIIDNDDGDDADDIDSSSLVVVGGSTITTSGVSRPTVVDKDHPFSLSINLHTLLIVGIAGGVLAIILLLLIIVVCSCSTRSRRVKNPLTAVPGKSDRGNSYPYEACNTLPPMLAPSASAAAFSTAIPLTTDFYAMKNSGISCQHPPHPLHPPHPPHHPSSVHSQMMPVAVVGTSGAAAFDPLIMKTTSKKDVKEWYV